jgi:hypothetical protein
MIGPEAGAWIAQVGFAILLVWGCVSGNMSLKAATIFLCLWTIAFVARAHIPYGVPLFSPVVAILDVALVFLIFKGDVRLT